MGVSDMASAVRRAVASAALPLSSALPYVLSAVCLACAAAPQLWFMRRDRPIGMDEGYMGALALRLIDGHLLPGVDGVGQRGPVLYWLVTLSQFLFGQYQWRGFRILAIAASSIVIVSLVGMSALVRKPAAGVLAAAFYVYTLVHVVDLGAGIGLSGELVAVPWLCSATMIAGLALASAHDRWRSALLVAAGVLAAMGGWTKVTLLPTIAPLWLWVASDSLRRPAPTWRARAQLPLALLGGWLLPTLAILALYSAAGSLDEFVYRFFVYNRDVHMGAYKDAAIGPLIVSWFHEDPWIAWSWVGSLGALIGSVGYAFGASHGEGRLAALARVDLQLVVLLQAALGFAVGIAQMRFWPHHFIAAIPWVGLALGFALDWLAPLRQRGARSGWTFGLALVASALLATTVHSDIGSRERERRAGAWRAARSDQVCREIRHFTHKSDTIFVWGFDGDLYVSCRRRPASRFVYTTPIAGIVPPFWRHAKPELVARGALRETLADLRASKPALIVDPLAWEGRVAIGDIPELKALLDADYCHVPATGDLGDRPVRLYARKSSGHCGSALPSSE